MSHHERGADDVSTRDDRLASLLDAASAPSEPGPQPGEAEVLAAFRASRPSIRRPVMHSTRARTKIALTAALSAGVLLTGGVGAAVAGSLPGAAQDTASEMLAAVGIEVPGADEHSAGHPDQRGTSEDSPATEDETSDDALSGDPDEATGEQDVDEAQGEVNGKGAAISDLAKDTESEGVDKGAEISGLASEGQSQAGQHGGSESAEDAGAESAEPADPQGADEHAPVETPNTGGTGTADDANDAHGHGSPAAGTDTADEASSGHSGAGSSNSH